MSRPWPVLTCKVAGNAPCSQFEQHRSYTSYLERSCKHQLDHSDPICELSLYLVRNATGDQNPSALLPAEEADAIAASVGFRHTDRHDGWNGGRQ